MFLRVHFSILFSLMLLLWSSCVPVANKTDTKAKNLFLQEVPTPIITSFFPSSGTQNGGTTILVSGEEFTSGMEVSIGGRVCSGFSLLSKNQFTCITPPQTPGSYPLRIINNYGQTSFSSSPFIYNQSPSITSVSPIGGIPAGGNTLTILGAGFLSGVNVTLGGVACNNITLVNFNTITCEPNGGAGLVNLVVTNLNGESSTLNDAYTYRNPPAYLSVSPTFGKAIGGEEITILGTDFINGVRVTIGGAACDVGSVNPTQITCTTSAGSNGLNDIVITNPDDQTDTGVGAFTYVAAPLITSLDFTSGSKDGGEMITITGDYFDSAAQVDIGGTAATVTLAATNTIYFTTPSKLVGSYDVNVENPDGQVGSLPSGFTYNSSTAVDRSPTVSSVSPDGGALLGGESVQITGSGFIDGATVTFGGVACTPVVFNSSTQLTCTAPAGAGASDVVVTNPNTLSGTLVSGYTFRNPPSILGVAPIEIPSSGGNEITISGADFLINPSIFINGNPCPNVTFDSSTSIRCFPPPSTAGFADVEVRNYDGQFVVANSQFEYVDAPTITSIAPSTDIVAGGNTLTVFGNGFRNGLTASLGGVDCPVGFVNPTSFDCSIPPGPGPVTVDVLVTNPDGQNAVLLNAFRYLGPPIVSSITPDAGTLLGGTLVTVTGLGFEAGASIQIGPSNCTNINIIDSTTITCRTPTGAGPSDVTVINPDFQAGTLGSGYTFQPAPNITNISPNSGPSAGGTVVTLSGSNFLNGATVDFDGSPCTVSSLTSVNIICLTSAHADGFANVTVTNLDGQSHTRVNFFNYIPSPMITSITPSSGYASGSTAVTIAGSNFVDNPATTITINGVTCSTPTITPTSITCTTGASAPGAYDVLVTNPDGQIGSLSEGYTYYGPPNIGDVNPDGGAIAGGTYISITGTDFQQGAVVTIGGNNCVVDLVLGDNQIFCTTTENAGGAALVGVLVNNPDGQSDSLNNAFEYRAGPTLTSIAPDHGISGGGELITLTGTNFLTGASVDIGGSPCANVVVVDANTITCTTTPRAAGIVDVQIFNLDYQNATLTSSFTYRGSPVLTSLTPSAGALAGGTTVTLSGANFYGELNSLDSDSNQYFHLAFENDFTDELGNEDGAGSGITFSTTSRVGNYSADFSGATDTKITSPFDLSTHTEDISFSFWIKSDGSWLGDGTSNASGVGLASLLSTTNDTLNVGLDPSAGRLDVRVSGVGNFLGSTNLIDNNWHHIVLTLGKTNPSSLKIYVDGVLESNLDHTTAWNFSASDFLWVGDSADTFWEEFKGQIDNLRYFNRILLPYEVKELFYKDPYNYIGVEIGDVICDVTGAPTSSSIECITRANLEGLYTAKVINPDGQTATKASAFTYQQGPTITSVAPEGGNPIGGTLITVTGTFFRPGATLTIGGVACSNFTYVNGTTLTCVTPAGTLGDVDLVVTNTDGQVFTFANGFTYQESPAIASISPSSGKITGGDTVVITGSDFRAGATVQIGGVDCTNLTVDSLTQITCDTGAVSEGIYNVTVTNTDNQVGSLLSGFIFKGPPIITSISPVSGALNGGTNINISGSNFESGITGSVGGNPCSPLTYVDGSNLICTTTGPGSGTVSLALTNPDTQVGTLANSYTYRAAPTFTSINPNAGNPAGGTTVTILGTNFFTGVAVNIGGQPCTNVTLLNSGTITCDTPALSLGTATVTVYNNDFQSVSTASAYTYQDAPTLTSLVALSGVSKGPLAGGTILTLTGTDFLSGAVVSLGGSPCSISALSSTSITCTTSAHGAGLVDAVITNVDNQSFTLSDAYEYKAAPTITGVVPPAGSLSGGTTITLTGTGFDNVSDVEVDGNPCTSFSQISSTSLTCVTPAHAAGIVGITVTNIDDQQVTLNNAYTYQSGPTLSSVSPDFGSSTGTTAITLTGTQFTVGASVLVGTLPCGSVTVVSGTNITCIAPAQAEGSYDITVTNPDNQSTTLSSAFDYFDPPTITSVSPTSGPFGGGDSVTLTGTSFRAGALVSFSGSICSITALTSTSITCTTGASAPGIVDVTISNTDGQSFTLNNGYLYNPAPNITSISPSFGSDSAGETVFITGSDFYSGVSVTIGSNPCTNVNLSGTTSISCITSATSAGLYSVIVTNADGQSAALPDSYRFVGQPIITSVTPSQINPSGGTTLTINGSQFLNGAVVQIAGLNCTGVTVISESELTCTAPAVGAGTYDIQIANIDGQASIFSSLTYADGPTLSSITPTKGPLNGGTTITLSGANFESTSTVTVGGNACTGVIYVSPTTLTCTTPINFSEGTYDVVVTNPDGQTSTLSSAFTYQAAPTLTSISPNAGAIGGGSTITVTGTGFFPGLSFSISGYGCINIRNVTSTSFDCDTIAAPAGTYSATLTNDDGQTVTLSNSFTYQSAPSVLSLSVTEGLASGGTAVTINGTNFINTAPLNVTFGGVACTGITWVSSIRIDCTTAAAAAGVVDVVVTNYDNQSGTLSNGFTYRGPPVLSSVTPSGGALAGGTTITLNGTGFYAGLTVNVGGSACTSVNVLSDIEATCVTPANPAGTADLFLSNLDGQTSLLTNGYLYAEAPVLSSISPNSGTTAGGNSVTITGSFFTSTPEVRFAGLDCNNIVFIDANTLTCDTPAHPTGFVTVEVENGDQQVDSLTFAYNYLADPILSSISPNAGTTLGSTAVTISGTGFLPGDTITIGGVSCSSLTVVNDSTITCTTGVNTEGIVDVVLNRASNGQSATLTSGYTYQGPPTLSSISPIGGNIIGGNTVTITGTNFVVGLSISIDGSNCPNVNYISDTQVTCTPLSHSPGTVDVVLTNPDLQFDTLVGAYTYSNAPTFSTLTTPSGEQAGALAGGTSITITGTNFVTTGTTTVDFGGSSCASVNVASTTSITCTTTAHTAGTVNVTITNPDGQSIVASNAYTYQEAPTITSISPTNGTIGNTLSINGNFFLSGQTVTINAVNCPIVTESTTILTCTVPANAIGSYNVVVTNPDDQLDTYSSFTYNPAPTISGLDVTTGPEGGGTSVVITGTGFISGLAVSVGASGCSNITYTDPTSVTCVTASGTPGAQTVTLTNPDGQQDTFASFTYIAAPDVISFTPNAGYSGFTRSVNISGANFVATPTVTIGATPCVSLSFIDANNLNCTVPALSEGSYTATVTNPDGQIGTLANAFTYVNAPDVTAVSPTSGSLNGGGTLSVSGTDFNVSSVTINGVSCPVQTSSSTLITCTIPAQVAGTYDVVVTNVDTQSDTLSSSYTYVSTAQLEWVVGGASPTPPNPDDYGSTTTNITHTYTLTNSGDVTSSAISINTIAGTPAAWVIGTDTCSGGGNELASMASCTVQMTFLGGSLPTGSYNTVLRANATTGGSTDNLLQGNVP